MRKIIAYKNYYREFMEKLSQQERDKIKRALLLFETEDRIPRHYISYIRDGVYEFRVTYGKKSFDCSLRLMGIPSLCFSTVIQRKRRKHQSGKLTRQLN